MIFQSVSLKIGGDYSEVSELLLLLLLFIEDMIWNEEFVYVLLNSNKTTSKINNKEIDVFTSKILKRFNDVMIYKK